MVADTSAGTESEDSEAQEDQSLLKVETQETSDNSDASSLLLCVQFLLRTHGIEKSIGSIRELSEQTEGEFDFSSAVVALRNLEFDANVGKLSAKKSYTN